MQRVELLGALLFAFLADGKAKTGRLSRRVGRALGRTAKSSRIFLYDSQIDKSSANPYADRGAQHLRNTQKGAALCRAGQKRGNSRMAGKNDDLTIAEIADALNISKTTVSRALSGKGRVSEATRARVFDYVGKGGAESPAPQRAARPGRTNNLALVIPRHFMRLDLPFLRKCMGGVWSMAAQRGYDLLLCYAGETDAGQLERQIRSHKVDGVILSRTMIHDNCVKLLQRYHVPFVAIGRVEDESVPQVDNDQVGASAEMTRLLLQLGMRRIAYMGGRTDYTVNEDRLRGYLRGFADCGVPADQRLIWTGIESDEQRTDALEALLEQHPECLLCADDNMTFSVLQALRARHIAVPGQLRLASFYDSELLSDAIPQVSAVQFDGERLGSTACRMLLDTLAGKRIVMRQMQGYQVILRESTKK